MLLIFWWNASAQQRVVAECTITYAINIDDTKASDDAIASLKSSSKTVFIKGMNSRTDLNSPTFMQSMIYQKNTGTAVILREFGANKFMTKLDPVKWKEENKKFEGIRIEPTAETKTIIGYECKKVNLIMSNGSTFSVYYTPAIAPSVKEFEYQFKDIPGLVLESESIDADGNKIRYTAKQINFNPVPPSKFDIPTSGYRIL
ncbi:hypothetical protein KACHI17_00640 [Sediminibacterium sp. KACHI17]|uniref:GLPGLI family protein n=2 Tax=Sediminibacterium sp. KACHI17 TaxID=1751071 RepID=A0AAT9GF73_9BACT